MTQIGGTGVRLHALLQQQPRALPDFVAAASAERKALPPREDTF